MIRGQRLEVQASRLAPRGRRTGLLGMVAGSIEEQPFIVAQIWQPATIAPEFFQRIFLDTGVQLTPQVLNNPLMLQQLDRGRKIYWQSKSEN